MNEGSMSDKKYISVSKDELFKEIVWNEQGLIPAIVQCHATKDVLMLAWMNAAALERSLAENRTVFWSRSRKELWAKGETSGAVQELLEVMLDCDGDCLLVLVKQLGTGACHTGKAVCFFRKYINT